MLGGHRRAANDEQINARVHDRAPVLLHALRRELAGNDHAGLAQLLEARRDERGLDRLGVDALEGRNRLLLAQVSDVVEDRGGVLVSGPQAVQVEHADTAEAAKGDRSLRTHHRVHRGRHQRGVDVVGVDLPADVDILGVTGTPRGHEGDIVQRVGAASALATTDFHFVAHDPILLPNSRFYRLRDADVPTLCHTGVTGKARSNHELDR